MKVVFNNEYLFCEEKDFKYNYLENDPKELYKVLQLLVDNETNLELELKSKNLLAKKFYDILNSEFNQFPF